MQLCVGTSGLIEVEDTDAYSWETKVAAPKQRTGENYCRHLPMCILLCFASLFMWVHERMVEDDGWAKERMEYGSEREQVKEGL